jgi:hypothetical protein
MDNNKRSSLRIKNKFIVYVKKIHKDEINRYKEDIYNTVDPSDSFSFFMSLNNLDSSFGNLNKAFIVMMKEMDAKLNYIIDIIRDKEYISKLSDFSKTYSCDLSKEGISFELGDSFAEENDFVFIKFILPIASHYEINAIGTVTRKVQKHNVLCYGCNFNDIKKTDVDLIIHYMLYFERKMLKGKGMEL